MKIKALMQLGFLGLMGAAFVTGCVAETGGEISILRVPLPTESCEISPEEVKTLASGVFDPVSNTVGDDAVRLGLIVKNGLRPGDSGGEVNDSGEDIGPAAPNNVVLTGFNVCYYLADDPAYKALISDGADALREDCESGSVAVKEFSASGGTLIAESDAKPEDGSLVYASLLRAAVLEQLFGSSFDLAALSGVGFDAANAPSPNCAGTNVASDGTFDPSCTDLAQTWTSGLYTPWVSMQAGADPSSANTAWGTYPFKCTGSDCDTLPTLASVNAAGFANISEYLFETYGNFQQLLPTARTTVVTYMQAVGETVTGSSVESSYFLFPIDLCVGCLLEGAYAACPQGLTPTVCSYGNCVVGDPGVNEATVEECVAPAQDFTGCPGDRTAACGPLESALVGEVPEITSCGGGYHLDRFVAYACQTRTCPQ